MSSLLKERDRLIEGTTLYKTRYGSIEVAYSQNLITYITPPLPPEKIKEILELEQKFPELHPRKGNLIEIKDIEFFTGYEIRDYRTRIKNRQVIYTERRIRIEINLPKSEEELKRTETLLEEIEKILGVIAYTT
jgi:hypothetical protein